MIYQQPPKTRVSGGTAAKRAAALGINIGPTEAEQILLAMFPEKYIYRINDVTEIYDPQLPKYNYRITSVVYEIVPSADGASMRCNVILETVHTISTPLR